MKKLLCKFAHWILDKCEPIDIWNTTIKTQMGTYKIASVEHPELTGNGVIREMTATFYLMDKKVW